jgi:hypothetical protein
MRRELLASAFLLEISDAVDVKRDLEPPSRQLAVVTSPTIAVASSAGHVTTIRACGLHVNATSEARHPAVKLRSGANAQPDAAVPLKA